MWYHGAGNIIERGIIIGIIDDFNASQSDWVVTLEEFPQESYNSSIVAAALSGDLPDIIDVDGPVMPGWAWAGYMAPLNLSEGALDDFLPGAIGEWNGEVYAVGLWDAAVAIYARRSVLEANDIRIPTLTSPGPAKNLTASSKLCKALASMNTPLTWAWLGLANGIPTPIRPSCRASAAT